MAEKESKNLVDYLKKVSPGTALRNVIEDLISANMGAIIVFDTPEVEKLIEGGFKINCRFTPSRLFELCKMDGAIIVSPDLKKILYSNVLLTPDNSVPTSETGTRHKAGERTAKQADTFVIVVSERRNKTTIYLSDSKYFLKRTTELLSEVSSNLQLLEKQREIFNELRSELNVLEVSSIVTVKEVCNIIQKSETILRIAEMIKRYFAELGNMGTIMSLRYKELIRGIEKTEDNILRDYSNLPLKKSKALLSGFGFDRLIELEILARLMIGKSLDESIDTRGYRFLSNLKLSEEEIQMLVGNFKSLKNIFNATPEELQRNLKNNDTEIIKREIDYLKDQILQGKALS